MTPKTLYQKVWEAHLVQPPSVETPAVMYVDLHLIHEVTSPQAFDVLRQRGLKVRQPKRVLATMDHSTPTLPKNSAGKFTYIDAQAEAQVHTLVRNCEAFGIDLFHLEHPNQGIVHVIGPELGATQPGMTVVCGDSHTSTHGAFGALAFGIGTTEVGYVLATQCLPQREAKTLGVHITGTLPSYVTAKDLILAIIARIGIGGGTGHVMEYYGNAIQQLSMEARMTVCNMSIEAGARAGMIAPDDTTFQYLYGRPMAPSGNAWDKAVNYWKTLPTDAGASYHRTVQLDANLLEPMITYGTNPEMGIGITQAVPAPKDASQAEALQYMGVEAGQPLLGKPIDVVFIGSCTNSRIEDLREAAHVLKGRKVHTNVRTLVVPGSQQVKKQAEQEGLHHIFLEAGAQWREPGCSMCIAMNGDDVPSGQYAVSTSNRNFKGRQGVGSKTLLASPLTAAACAVTGCVSDVRKLLS
jgi:3-isopropylmalate/(R)-2-methylmalate dehydratase large subunit